MLLRFQHEWMHLALFLVLSLLQRMAALSLAARRTLLVATTKDIASLNIANALVARDESWKEVADRVWDHSSGQAWLWLQDESLLKLDNPHTMSELPLSGEDKKFIEEVIFLSRHSAASGVASLTVHPIGVAWLDDTESLERYGGKARRCSPPSARIARIYRNLLAHTQKLDLSDTFEVTMEATHHGPFCEIPTCFVEIGSDEKTWENADAANLWSDLLEEELQLPVESSEAEGGVVVALLGGGHYIPKMNDCARFGDNIYVGHSIASYGLQSLLLAASTFEKETQGEQAAITWKSVVMECINSTKVAHPSRQLVVLIDKKAFKADGRSLLTGLLDNLHIPYCWSVSDVKKLWQAAQEEQSTSSSSKAESST